MLVFELLINSVNNSVMEDKDLIIESEGGSLNITAFLRKILSHSESTPIVLTQEEQEFIDKIKSLF